jgi:hypothetical protein
MGSSGGSFGASAYSTPAVMEPAPPPNRRRWTSLYRPRSAEDISLCGKILWALLLLSVSTLALTGCGEAALQSPDQGSDLSLEQGLDQSSDRSLDQSSDQLDQSFDQLSFDQSFDRGPDQGSLVDASAPTGTTFASIAAKGLNNGCYPDAEHYLAEYLLQNPTVCFWKVDQANSRIVPLPFPQPPANAVKLPPPSGGDDTKALAALINKSNNGAVVGQGTYKVNKLTITVPVDIFNMPMIPTSNATEMVLVDSPDVRIFNSPIDGKNVPSFHTGFKLLDGAHRVVIARSGVSNIYNKNGVNSSGVRLRGVNDFHIVCNSYKNIVGYTADSKSSKPKLDWATARANAFWMSGSKTTSTSGGIFANNYGENFQSNGSRNDAEFFTVQSYAKTDAKKPVRFYANRGLNAGKRMTKSQESNLLALSNDYEWRDKTNGPLGSRSLFCMVNIHFSDNVIARNNRFKVAADGRFDFIFRTNLKGRSSAQENIHFDCNDIEIEDKIKPSSGAYSYVIAATTDDAIDANFKYEAINSSANNNVIHGAGNVRFHYYFDKGYRKKGGRFETKNNVFTVPFVTSEYR